MTGERKGGSDNVESDHDMLVKLVVLAERMQRDMDRLRGDFDRDGQAMAARLVVLERHSISREDVDKILNDQGLPAQVAALAKTVNGLQMRLAAWAGAITVGGLVLHFGLEWALHHF